MSNLLFDLNIYNYSINELKILIKLKENYNYEDIKKHISSIKDNILKLKLNKNENRAYFLFLDNITFFLKNDLEEQKNKILEKKILLLKNNQELLKNEIDILKKRKKIKKNRKID